jgi:hypothetical protein
MRKYFESNIGISKSYNGKNPYTGVVIASPSYVDPNYLYHWQRDAAISMNVLQFTAPNTTDFDEHFQNYIKWVTNAQAASDPNGINVLGEPKFFIDGEVYNGGWCRPQNDGPASRSTALSHYALWLIANNRSQDVINYGLYIPQSGAWKAKAAPRRDHEDAHSAKDDAHAPSLDCDVQPDSRTDCGYPGINQQQCESSGCCWGPVDPNPNNDPWCFYSTTGPTPAPTPPSLISTDLDYVSQVWNNNGNNCDLWEEVRGPNFYTYMVQHRAFQVGSEVAAHFGDDTLATQWNNTADDICDSAQQFDNNGFISETARQYDCSVILAPLYGGSPRCFPPTSSDVLNTANTIRDFFDGYLQVNENDDNMGLPGTLLGRYESDVYPGCSSNGGGQGHAWILCSNALGDLYYRNSLHLAKLAKDDRVSERTLDTEVGAERLRAYAKNLDKDMPLASKKLHSMAQTWEAGDLSRTEKIAVTAFAARATASSGDGQLTRVKYHTQNCDMHLSEQICETSGETIGAFDLTWSYGTMLSAWYYRGEATKFGVEPLPFEREIAFDAQLKAPQCVSACSGSANSGTCCSGQC